jgi:tetraacyldisaccharide 4'-kinase
LKRKGNILLWPVSLLYGAVTAIRNFLYNTEILKSHEFNIPVICVGNITVGGTGKTPHTEYLINLLKDEFRIAVLSRGYGRNTSGFLTAGPGTGPSDIGDEPFQVFSKFPEVTVAVCSDRVEGIRRLKDEIPGLQAVLLDDGYQHRRLRPGFSILLTDFSRLMIHDRMLPYGDLRESASNMSRADIILVTKSPASLPAIQRRIIVKDFAKAPWQNLYFTTFDYGDPVPLFTANVKPVSLPLKENRNENAIILLTGIARSEALKEYVSQFAVEPLHLQYSDHHPFTHKDVADITAAFDSLKGEKRYIITTEKDAVRLREFTNIAEAARSAMFFIPVRVSFLNEDAAEFDNIIQDYVRKNKRNS